MKTLSLSILFVAGLSALSAGCQGETDSDLDTSLDKPALTPKGSGPNGTGGLNAYLPSHFKAMRRSLVESFKVPAQDPANQGKVNPVLDNLFQLTSPEGERTMHYAAGCALSVGTALTYGGYDFKGDGFIHHGDEWLKDPIFSENLVRDGVLTCMAARLNPYGQVVKILELGPMVPADGVTNTDDYEFREMVISAVYDPNVDGLMTINVWPLEDLAKSCGLALEGSLGSRICDNNPAGCGLVLRNDFNTACTGSPGAYWCDGVPAIETRLKQIDLGTLHPECD